MADTRDDVHRRLGVNVRTLRVRRGLTQEMLGEKAGLSYKFIGEVERGVSNPSVESVSAIAKALDADIADLFGGAGRPAGAYDASRKQLAVVRDAHERLASALKDLQNATLGRVARKQRRKTKD